jgi:uncharacterized protein YbjQ (UPF0145 family)
MHLARLKSKEREFSSILICNLNTIPANWKLDQAFLVTGSVVIANDYFKAFAATLRNLLGGRMRSYETLLERGRREAVIRMLGEARNGSANAVWNVRFAAAAIQGEQQGRGGGIELVAYGTALRAS